jgi:regulatory protein
MALRHLDRRAYGIAELKTALVRKGADEQAVDQALARLAKAGLLDDDAYAAALVEQRHTARHLSRRAVALDLRRRGLADDVVEAATGDLDDDSDWHGARAVAAAQMRRLAGLDDTVARRRLTGALARRGYDPGIVGGVVAEVLGKLGG